MTTIYKDVEITKIEKEEVKTVCDWCGKEIEEVPECAGTNPRTSISFTLANSCYEGSYGDGWSIEDLCEVCGEKLKNALIGLGITVTDFDWQELYKMNFEILVTEKKPEIKKEEFGIFELFLYSLFFFVIAALCKQITQQ